MKHYCIFCGELKDEEDARPWTCEECHPLWEALHPNIAKVLCRTIDDSYKTLDRIFRNEKAD